MAGFFIAKQVLMKPVILVTFYLNNSFMYDGVFISYRREGSSSFAGVLYDVLCKNFPSGVVFKDKNKLLPGKDFRDGINHGIDLSHTMLVLIDRNWLNMTDDKGNKRLWKEDDFIRYEIKTAIEKTRNIIPVLFDGGKMPAATDLPPDINKLCDFQAFEIDADNTTESINELVTIIRSLSTQQLGNTLTEAMMKLKKDPKGTFKNISESFMSLSKREANVINHYMGKFFKKKKE